MLVKEYVLSVLCLQKCVARENCERQAVATVSARGKESPQERRALLQCDSVCAQGAACFSSTHSHVRTPPQDEHTVRNIISQAFKGRELLALDLA